MRSCIFSIITAVFSVTWSSEIILICWFAAQETFLIIINVENTCADEYFCGNWHNFFSGNRKFKRTAFDICKIISKNMNSSGKKQVEQKMTASYKDDDEEHDDDDK